MNLFNCLILKHPKEIQITLGAHVSITRVHPKNWTEANSITNEFDRGTRVKKKKQVSTGKTGGIPGHFTWQRIYNLYFESGLWSFIYLFIYFCEVMFLVWSLCSVR